MKKTLLQLINSIKHHELTHRIRVMKLILLFAFLATLQSVATNAEAQNVRVHISKESLSLAQLFQEIEQQTEYLFVYNDADINLSKQVKINKRDQNVSDILRQALSPNNIIYEFANNYISLRVGKAAGNAPVSAQQQVPKILIKGTIVDQTDIPIIGANVLLKGSTAIGTITDLDGVFNLEVPANGSIVISYIGYKNKEVAINNQLTFSIRLEEDVEKLTEVVVTALGIRREEKALGYAVQKVSGEKLATVKSVDVGTALTGKIAGLNVNNSTEFNEAPRITLRGENPLLVVDGVPYNNVTLRDIASDDIESIDVLKGSTASALYGSRGGSGAIMITTKRGQEEGLNVNVNSSTMFDVGFLRIPEVQTSYSTGMNGKYNPEDFVWGDKMDIGRTAVQYDPYTFEWREMPLVSKGKNNFENFLETSFVTNNNISVTQKGKYGSFRTSLTHVYNKGQYPNTKLNKLTYTVSGDMKWNNLILEGGMTYNKRFYPNNYGTGYGKGGYIYSMLIWSGTDVDIREYKNYWRVKDKEESWPNEVWYDNPYFIANEIIHGSNSDVVNGFLNMSYTLTSWLKASLRSGVDFYNEDEEWRNPISARGGWHKKGYYAERKSGRFSSNSDFILSADHTFGNFVLDAFVGGTIYFLQDNYLQTNTRNGITIPGYYSIYASVDPAAITSSLQKKQVNSLYGKASLAWKSMVYLDVTARNDWSSTLPSNTRSYFYPSISGSFVGSEIIHKPDWLSFWKIRASWTETKSDLSIYDTNTSYKITPNLWDGLSGAAYPTEIKDPGIMPSATRSYEIGTNINFLQNRIRLDVAYYNKLYYNLTYRAPISDTSGFEYALINIDEERTRKGVEISLGADVIKNKDFSWNTFVNWSSDRLVYSRIDPIYSSQRDWVRKGKRVDYYTYNDWERDPQGSIIHEGGYPIQSKYQSVAGYASPDWIFGFSNTFKYKQFTLYASIDGRIGGVTHSVTNQALWMTGAHIDSDTQWRYDEVVNNKKSFIGDGVKVVSGSVDRDVNGNILRDDRVFAVNDRETSYESYMKLYHGAGNVWSAKHQHILDQSFIKLREISLTYDLSFATCNKLKLKGASVSLIGSNLFMWTKDFKYSDPDKSYDPNNSRTNENLNSPSLRMLGANIKVNF